MERETTAPAGKHIPVRMCVVCRERRPKAELSRYVRSEKGQPPVFDPESKMPGRGMYVCDREDCRKRFESGSRKK